MHNTVIKKTKHVSRKLDEKNDILCKFIDSNIFKNFANSFLQNDIISESSRQPTNVLKNFDGSFLNFLPQCFECVNNGRLSDMSDRFYVAVEHLKIGI